MSAAPSEDQEIARLYRRYITMVRERCVRLLGDPSAAEDAAQEVFVRFLDKHRGGFRADNSAGLLYRMATNLTLNRLRDDKRRRELLTEHASSAQTIGAGADDAHADHRIDLRRALSALPLELSTIATYYYVDGMDQEEIAALLDMRRRTVSRRLEAFRTKAQRLLTRGAPP